ncbi:cellulose synthase operon protein c [Anaeramoeba flamelloides]|uniref:Cellulose synthase operon protein c n=1 Tax=Anaeramoeba flamelloides TaxID=1746091 RepID=A0ABQ8Z517_9EUKA|nr:cellulose synthase operon protein c [Anaeramoeba flamelloides]
MSQKPFKKRNKQKKKTKKKQRQKQRQKQKQNNKKGNQKRKNQQKKSQNQKKNQQKTPKSKLGISQGLINSGISLTEKNEHFQQGMLHVDKQKFEEAIELFEKAIEESPENEVFHFVLGEVLAKCGKYELSLSSYSKAIELNPQKPVFFYSRALIYSITGKAAQSVNDLTRVIELKPKSVESLSLRGNIYLSQLQDLEMAKKDLLATIEIDPKHSEAWSDLGVVYDQEHSHERAIECFSNAIKCDPKEASYYTNMAKSLNADGRFEEALQYIEKSLKLDSNKSDIWFEKGNSLLFLDQNDEAIECFNKAIEISPKEFIYYTGRASVYSVMGKFEKSIQDYNKAIELSPQDKNKFIFERGVVRLSAKQPNKSLTDFNYLLKLEPLNAEYLNMRGCAHDMLGSFENSLKDFKSASIIDPKNSLYSYNTGEVLFRYEKWDQAKELFLLAKKTLKEDDDDDDNLEIIINAALSIIDGEIEKAIKLFTQVIDKEQDDEEDITECYYFRGRAYEQSNQIDFAIKDYQKVIKLNPDFNPVKDRLHSILNKKEKN